MVKIWFKSHVQSVHEYYLLVPSSGPVRSVRAALESAGWTVTRVESTT